MRQPQLRRLKATKKKRDLKSSWLAAGKSNAELSSAARRRRKLSSAKVRTDDSCGVLPARRRNGCSRSRSLRCTLHIHCRIGRRETRLHFHSWTESSSTAVQAHPLGLYTILGLNYLASSLLTLKKANLANLLKVKWRPAGCSIIFSNSLTIASLTSCRG
jgi:hypothetical protein